MSAILLMMKYFKEKDNAVFILADVSNYERLQFYLSFEWGFDKAWVLKCFMFCFQGKFYQDVHRKRN